MPGANEKMATGVEKATGFMALALGEARVAAARGEIPVGCVVVCGGEVIANAGNAMRGENDPTAHAEIVALRMAAKRLGTSRLDTCDLYSTLEPCPMCAGAISLARIRRLYYGARDEKGGAVESGVRLFASPTCHHVPEIYSGFAETEAARLLKQFFATKR